MIHIKALYLMLKLALRNIKNNYDNCYRFVMYENMSCQEKEKYKRQQIENYRKSVDALCQSILNEDKKC